MKNNAFKDESKDKRLKRLQDNSYVEAIETLLNSIDNHFNNEIRQTIGNYQTSLLFMGIHATALTISEAFFNKGGLRGYKLFVQTYIDGQDEDKKFSLVADTIHDWRNVLAHQWIGSIGHQIGYDYKMKYGWQDRDGVTFINPGIYCKQYLSAFKSDGKLWQYQHMFSEEHLEQVKLRIITKYLNQ